MSVRVITVIALILGAALFTQACSSSTSPSSVSSITITGTSPGVGSSSQLAATAIMSDGSTQDITSTATWASSTATVATVSSTGAVTGVGSGTSTITATVGTVSGFLQVTVS